MNFAAPIVLWALPLVLVPIIIHLLQKRRFHRVEFSAMDFLMRAVRRTRRRVLLEDILLLILRTLAVLFLILALARPNSKDLPLVLGRDARAEVLILDASLSMNHMGDGQSAYGKALSIAAKRLRELDSKMEDRAAVIRAGMRAERVASGDPDEVRSVLEELEMADPSQGDLLGALHAAARTVEDLGPDPSRISVTVLTDLQANTWNIESGFSAPFAELVALGCDVQILDCGASLRDNVGVTGIELSTPRLVRGDSCSVLVTLRNFGETETTVQATLLMDETPIASESFVLGGRQPIDWNVAVAPVKGGARALEVRLEHDALVGDDTRASILDVGDGFRVMIAGEASISQDAPNVFDGMWRYLSLGEWAPLRPTALPLPLVDPAVLAEFDLLILADAGRVSLRTAEGIADFVNAGGGLMIALGPETGQKELQDLLQQLGAIGLSVGTPIQANETPARLDIVDANTPALRFFNDARWKPLLTEVPHATYRPLNVDPNLAENLHIGLRFLQQDADLDSGAALVDWELGLGKIAVLASSPLPSWNRMEELPGGTLPLIYDLLFSLAPKPGFPVAYPVGSALSLQLNHPPTDTQLRDPTGLLLNGLADLESLKNGRTRLELLKSVPRPGVWHLSTRLLLPDGEEVALEQPLAVVIPTEESDLRAAEATSLYEFLPESVRIGGPDENLVLAESSGSPPQDLTRTLLLLVLAFLVSETLFAWFLDRRRNL